LTDSSTNIPWGGFAIFPEEYEGIDEEENPKSPSLKVLGINCSKKAVNNALFVRRARSTESEVESLILARNSRRHTGTEEKQGRRRGRED
jgi:hypothetical protein